MVQNNSQMSEKSPKSKEKLSILGYLKKIVTWQSVSVLVAIVVPFIIYYWQKEDNAVKKTPEIELLRDSINMSIATIEETFHPEEAPIENKEGISGVLVTIRNFQREVLSYTTYWTTIESSPSPTSFCNAKVDDAADAVECQGAELEKFMMTYENILWDMCTIHEYGVQEHNPNLSINQPMYIKMGDYFSTFQNRCELIVKDMDAYRDELLNIKPNDSDYVKDYPQYIKILTLYHNMLHSEEFYRHVHYSLLFFIQQNKKYEDEQRIYRIHAKTNDVYSKRYGSLPDE